MKTIKLTPTDFYQFRILALSVGIFFMCDIVHSEYVIKAKTTDLEILGY